MKTYGVSFEEDVKLNKLDLSNEAEVMSAILDHWSKQLAVAKQEKDTATVSLERIEFEREMFYRTNGTGLAKDTENSIKAAVAIDPRVVAANEDLNEAKGKVYDLEEKVSSLKNKSDMIKVEKDLWIGGYFS